ncbi:Nucleolar protein 16 [Marasmius tenuissimus]|nr:Nucleolar protein 16 [Marasmius tenuissimus]
MANPRQRRKARSSSHKPVSHSKHAKRNLKKVPPIRAPKVLQDAWDKRKTVRQNYAALGLVHDLNPSAAGGAEIIEVEQDAQFSGPSTTEAAAASSASSSIHPPQNTSIPKGYGRIVRDEAGHVVHIELPDEEQDTEENSVEDVEMDMEQSALDLEESVREKWVEGLGAQSGRPKIAAVKENVVGGEFKCDLLPFLLSLLFFAAVCSDLISLSVFTFCHLVYATLSSHQTK